MDLPQGKEALGDLVSIAASQFYNYMTTGKYGDLDIPLKVLFSEGTDFVHMRGDRLKTIEAIDNLDLLVSINLTMNDTSLVADIVLPVCEWCEYEDIGGNRSYTPFLLYQEKVQEPMYETKSDFEIVKLLLRGMGHGDLFDWETPEDLLRQYFGDALYEQIRADKSAYAPFFVERGYEYIYGKDGKWDTTTGKAQIYVEIPSHGIEYESYGQPEDISHSRVPRFLLPGEAWNEDVIGYPKYQLADKYPLSLMAEHKKWNAQTCFSRSEIIRQLDPEPTLYISETDALSRGISEGDYVRCFNDRGEVVALCHIHTGMRPGMVNMPNGWFADQYVLGSQIDIANDQCDPDNESCNFADALVEVEVYEGEVN
jgi:molybdopterin-containing oxidoreductase family molybdopterin binding subunit